MPAAVTCAGTTDFDRTCAGCDRFRPDEPHRSVPVDAQATVCRRSMRGLKSARAAISTNPVNVPDPIRKRFGYGQSRPVMAVTASVQPESARIVYMPDPTSRLRFSSVFPKKAWLIVCETDPGLIWMAWSGFGQTQLFWKQAGVQESAGPVSGRTQTARYQFPTFQTRFRSSTDVPDNTVQNQPVSELVLDDCVRFWPNGSGPELSRCARLIRPASGQCFPADLEQMRIGSGMFTGNRSCESGRGLRR